MSTLINGIFQLAFWAFMLAVVAFLGGSHFEIPPFQTDGPVHRWISENHGGMVFDPGDTRSTPTERISVGDVGEKTFRWENINSARIVKNTSSYQNSGGADRFEVHVDIDEDALTSIVNRFGPPSVEGPRRFPVGIDPKDWFAKYGVLLDGQTMRPDYNWLVAESVDATQQLGRDLLELASRKGYTRDRDKVGLAASFVQHAIPYKVPSNHREDFNGQMRDILGLLPPLEVLYRGFGDCDSKSVLFATLLREIPRQEVILLLGLGHMFVGFRATPRHGEAHVSVRGETYVLIEATKAIPIGIISPQYLQGLKNRELQIIAVRASTTVAKRPKTKTKRRARKKGKG